VDDGVGLPAIRALTCANVVHGLWTEDSRARIVHDFVIWTTGPRTLSTKASAVSEPTARPD
jgi:hypothetical protein